MVPVAQETTANTVRLPYSFSRRFSLVAWCEASLEILHVHPLSLSVLQELQRGTQHNLHYCTRGYASQRPCRTSCVRSQSAGQILFRKL